MAAFDPDAYLAEKAAAPAFDPDAYLAEKAVSSPPVGEDATGGRPRGFAGSGGAGPGSVDPDEKPAKELATNRKFDPGAYGPHAGDHARTEAQRTAKLDADATASHTDDPGVQMIAGGIMGAGAGSVIGAGARALPLVSRAAPVLEAAGAGGVANNTQGGDFATGALLGGGGAAVPLVGRTLTNAARAGAAGSLERSAARAAESSTPVRDAAAEAVADVKKHAMAAGGVSLGAEMLGGHGAISHGITGLATAYAVGRPIARAVGVAADEGVARLLRRFSSARGVAEEASPFASEGWTPRRDTPLAPSWSPRVPVAEEAAPGVVEAPPVAAAPPSALDKAIALAKEARVGATKPEQDAIDKAIAGYEKRKSAPPREAQATPPGEQLAPTLEERANATRDDRRPAPPDVPAAAEKAPGASPPSLPGRPANDDIAERSVQADRRETDANTASQIEQSARARKVAALLEHVPERGESLAAMSQEQRDAFADAVGVQSPSEETWRDLMSAAKERNSFSAKPTWTPGTKDAAKAKAIGLTVDAYRDLMTKRAARISGYTDAVTQLARAAKAAPSKDIFIRAAVPAGVTEANAGKMWEAAHPRAQEATP
jgi:hypothetical protein